MSIPAINRALSLVTPRISAGARLVLVRLADRANTCGLAWPTVRSIARDVGLSERQVQRHLRLLEALSLISVHLPSSPTSATTYRVFPGVTLVGPSARLGDDIDDIGGVTRATPKPPAKPPRAGRTATPSTGQFKTEAPIPVLTKLAHQAIDTQGADALIADLAADLKTMCARLHLSSKPHAMTAALTSALHQRRRRS